MLLFVQLLLSAGTSLRGACRVWELLASAASDPFQLPPDWTTVRSWVVRLGYYELSRVKEPADDWVWMVDHSAQIGVQKCLVILGVRLANLPPPGECLQHQDMELIELSPVTGSNQELVHQQLEEVSERTGIVPHAILEDHGADLRGGVARFCERRPTLQIYDIKHKAACVLKQQLETDPQWQAFCTRLGQTKFKVQQTAAAYLVPPSQRSKSRWMNVGGLTRWGSETLAVLDRPTPAEGCSKEQLNEYFGWLRNFRRSLREWREMQQIVDVTDHFVRTQGLFAGAAEELARRLKPLVQSNRSRQIAAELIEFVEQESSPLPIGRRVPGSTEVLESVFGKLKSLEAQQSKSGFTQYVLAIGAIVAEKTTETIHQAMTAVRNVDISNWCRTKIGVSLQAMRRKAYKTPPAAEQNRDENALPLH